MFKRLKDLDHRYHELESLLSDPDVVNRQAVYQKYAKEHADLQEIVHEYRRYEQVIAEIDEGQKILHGSDEELKTLVKEETPELKAKLAEAESRLRILLLPK